MYPATHKEENMAFYRVCSCCGANLDFGERCDCQDKEKTAPVLEHRSGSMVKSDLLDHIFTLMIPSNKQKIKGDV